MISKWLIRGCGHCGQVDALTPYCVWSTGDSWYGERPAVMVVAREGGWLGRALNYIYLNYMYVHSDTCMNTRN